MEMQDKFNIHIDIMEYNSIVSALNKARRKFKSDDIVVSYPFVPSFCTLIYESTKGSQVMYLVLVKNDLTNFKELEWKDYFKLPFLITKILNYSGYNIVLTINLNYQ